MMRVLFLLAAFFAVTAAAPFDPFAQARIDEHPGAQVPLATPVVNQDGVRITLGALSAGRRRRMCALIIELVAPDHRKPAMIAASR